MTDSQYPIGRFQSLPAPTDRERLEWIRQIADAPANLLRAVSGMSDPQLDTPYRSGGWTLRQVVHHLADSHMNAYVRTRLLLTEECPAVKPYNEALWAELVDARTAAIEVSSRMLQLIHQRWVMLLGALPAAAFSRTLRHPERGIMSLDDLVQLYSWHGKHHIAQILALRERSGW